MVVEDGSAVSVVWAHATEPLPGEVWSPRRGNWPTPPRGDFTLMRELKRTLDPNNVFNPGRLFGDI